MVAGEVDQPIDAAGHVIVVRTARDADTSQTGPCTDADGAFGRCGPPTHADSTAADTASPNILRASVAIPSASSPRS